MNFNFNIRPDLPDDAPPPAARLPDDPLADAPVQALLLLGLFLLSPDATRTTPPGLLRVLGERRPLCRVLPRLVALAQRCPAVRHELDRGLDRVLGAEAAGFEPLSPFELAALWSTERERLSGEPLAAFLWVLARRNDLPSRRLAARVAASLESRRLQTLEALLDG